MISGFSNQRIPDKTTKRHCISFTIFEPNQVSGLHISIGIMHYHIERENMDYNGVQARPDETNLIEINIREWKKKYPQKAALVKVSNDGLTAKLIIQAPSKSKEMLESKKNLIYENDSSYQVI